MTALLTGLGLAAAAGWNAWAVLLFFNGIFRLLPEQFPGPTAAFLSSRGVLQLALVLFLAEFVIDKIPVADRFWDLGQTVLRPLVGAALALAASTAAGTAGLAATAAAGMAATLGAHLVKSTTRLTSTAATRGFAQFAVSLAEDIVAVVLATLAFFVPTFAAVLLAGLVILLATHRHEVWRAVRVLFFQLKHPRRLLREAARGGS
ncbi:MAG TPA: DUF4126 domain-containing protein [Thermoanaerobaculia bacterium]